MAPDLCGEACSGFLLLLPWKNIGRARTQASGTMAALGRIDVRERIHVCVLYYMYNSAISRDRDGRGRVCQRMHVSGAVIVPHKVLYNIQRSTLRYLSGKGWE